MTHVNLAFFFVYFSTYLAIKSMINSCFTFSVVIYRRPSWGEWLIDTHFSKYDLWCFSQLKLVVCEQTLEKTCSHCCQAIFCFKLIPKFHIFHVSSWLFYCTFCVWWEVFIQKSKMTCLTLCHTNCMSKLLKYTEFINVLYKTVSVFSSKFL